MAITPVDLMNLAQDLAKRPDEVSQRAAASKAYYFAFHTCKSLLREIRTGPELGGPSHRAVIAELTRFNSPSNPNLNRKVNGLGYMLAQLSDLRSVADYELDEDFSEATTRMVMAGALKAEERVREIHHLI